MILVAIGANLPAPDGRAPIETCRQAAIALDALPGLRLRGLSRWYLTAPVPPSGSAALRQRALRLCGRNQAARIPILTCCSPHCRRSRRKQGASRSEPNAARTLDLDIIAMGPCGQLVRTTPDPVLPHPRAHERAFVLVPLLDVAPDWIHPCCGAAPDELLAAVPQQGLRPCDAARPAVSRVGRSGAERSADRSSWPRAWHQRSVRSTVTHAVMKLSCRQGRILPCRTASAHGPCRRRRPGPAMGAVLGELTT